MSKLSEFVEEVEGKAERPGEVILINKEAAVAAAAMVKGKLAALAKGGKNAHRNRPLSTDPKAVKSRRAVARWRKSKKEVRANGGE